MALKQFRFGFNRDDGTTVEAVSEPLNLQLEDYNTGYPGTIYTVSDLVLDGRFGATTGIAFTDPSPVLDDIALLNKLLGFTCYANTSGLGTYIASLPSPVVTTLDRAGLVPKRVDGNIHLFADVQLWHTWDLQKTGTTDRYTISTGQGVATLVDLGYVPMHSGSRNFYLNDYYIQMLVRRLLPSLPVLSTEPKLEGLDWENNWNQTGGVSDSPSGARLLTNVKTYLLGSPY